MAQRFDRLRQSAATQVGPARRFRLTGRAFVSLIAFLVLVLFFAWQGQEILSRPPTFGFGQEGQVGAYVYTVQNVETSRVIGTGFLSREAGGLSQSASGKYKAVSVFVRNVSDEDQPLSESTFTVVDSRGIEYLPVCRADLGSCAEYQQSFRQSYLAPGEEVLGLLIFDVESDAQGLYLKVLRDPTLGTFSLFQLE